jgi:hypothetical protein
MTWFVLDRHTDDEVRASEDKRVPFVIPRTDIEVVANADEDLELYLILVAVWKLL